MKQIVLTSPVGNTAHLSRQMKILVGLLLLIVPVALLIPNLFYFLTANNFLSVFKLPVWTIAILAVVVITYPVTCFILLKNHRLCLILASLIILSGDYAPGLASPIAVILTLPNFIYLIYLNRNSRIKYLLLPLFVLSSLYFFNAFFLNFIANPIEITFVKINIGWLGAFGGALIVYHLMYLPLVIYHIASTDREFLKTYGFLLSLFINVVVLFGIYQFITLRSDPEETFRVYSIFRNTNRLGLFAVISLTLFITSLFETKDHRMKLYWWVSIALGSFVIMLTYSRSAMGAFFILWLFMAISLIISKAYRKLALLFISSLVFIVMLKYLGQIFQIDYLTRLEFDKMESSYEKRLNLLDIYLETIRFQSVSSWHTFLNTLFGYGWFSERRFINMDTHNTFFSCFSTFGLTGMALYFTPYLFMLWLTCKGCLKASSLAMRVRCGIASALLIIFPLSGLFHNKLYSPVESAYIWILIGIILRNELPLFFPKETESDKGLFSRHGRTSPYPKRLVCLRR